MEESGQKTSISQDQILAFISKNQPVKQSLIVAEIMTLRSYTVKSIARSTVSQMLSKLEIKGLIKKESLKNEAGGSINYNVWSIA